MANYMDGMEGGKHNSDNVDVSFSPKKKKKITRSNIGEHLFDEQLRIVGKTRVDIIDDDRWRFNLTLTREQYYQFRKYSIALLMKTFKFRKEKAIKNFEWFMEMFGVRIKN